MTVSYQWQQSTYGRNNIASHNDLPGPTQILVLLLACAIAKVMLEQGNFQVPQGMLVAPAGGGKTKMEPAEGFDGCLSGKQCGAINSCTQFDSARHLGSMQSYVEYSNMEDKQKSSVKLLYGLTQLSCRP